MKKIVVIPAGSSAWADSGASPQTHRIQGTVPLPLTETDKRCLQQAAEQLLALRPDCLYSSGNESAGPTAEYLGQLCSCKPRTIADFRELNCGVWQGLRIAELEKRFGRTYRQWVKDPTSVCPPHGETVHQAEQRLRQALQTVNKRHRDKTVLLVAAPMVAGVIECILTNKPLGQLRQLVSQTAGPQSFDVPAGHDFTASQNHSTITALPASSASPTLIAR